MTDSLQTTEAGEAREPEIVYLGRQPILDRAGALHAYELLFRDSPDNYARVQDDVQATAHVVARAVGEIGLSAVLGDYRGYVNMNRALLFDDIVHIMPPERFVLELLETITFDAALYRRCAQLREAGFEFALDDVVRLDDAILETLPYVDTVKVDFLAADQAQLPELARVAQAARQDAACREDRDARAFRARAQAWLRLLPGLFLRTAASARDAPPERIAHCVAAPAVAARRRTRDGHARSGVEAQPEVVVQLLRLANSSAFGLSRHVSSLREAIAAIGTRQITRWTQLLLYADGRDLPWRSDPLVQLVGTRARFMELAARVSASIG